MSALGTENKPEAVYLVEWTDIFGVERKALSLQKRDVESIRTVDTDARVTEGEVTWE